MFDEYNIYKWKGRTFIKGTVLPKECQNLYLDILENKSKFYDALVNLNQTKDPAPWYSTDVFDKKRLFLYKKSTSADIVDISFVELDDLDKIKNTMSDTNAMRTLPALQKLLPFIQYCVKEIMQDDTKYYLKNWLNISPKNQRLPPHTHRGTYHGYWVIKDTGTQTIYNIDGEDFPVENFTGNFVFGPADVFHALTPNKSDALRISLGFTVYTAEQKRQQKKYPETIFDELEKSDE